jgi:hypothetical protein
MPEEIFFNSVQRKNAPYSCGGKILFCITNFLNENSVILCELCGEKIRNQIS